MPAGVGQTAVWFPVSEGGAAADWRSYVTKAKGQSLPSAGARSSGAVSRQSSRSIAGKNTSPSTPLWTWVMTRREANGND
jgi:hypothetical protein